MLPEVLSSSAAAELGLTARRLESFGYEHPMRGLYVGGWSDPNDPVHRIVAAAAIAAPGVTIGGWAAARVHEDRACPPEDTVRVFDGRAWCGAPGLLAPVLLLAAPETRIAGRRGFRVFRSRVPDQEREVHTGIPVTTPVRTAFDLARLSSPVEAVVAVDRMMSLGLVQREDLSLLIDDRPRWRGHARARRALGLAEGRVLSPMETVMRLEWLAAGLPRPLCNAVVEDSSGSFVAMVDLLDEATGLVGEYDGDYHAGAERRRTDAARRELMVEVGLTPVTMTSADRASASRIDAWRRRLVRQRVVAAQRRGTWRVRPTAT